MATRPPSGRRVDLPSPPEDPRSRDVVEEFYPSQNFAVIDSAGFLNVEYPIGFWSIDLESGLSCAFIVVADSEADRVLVALPEQVWHKKPAKRKIDSKLLNRPSLISVESCSLDSREELIPGETLKVWMGYLPRNVVEDVDFLVDDVPTLSFHQGGLVPAAEALQSAAADLFGFRTAESGEPAARKEEGNTQQRIDLLENMMLEMKASLDKLTGDQGRGKPSTAAPKRRHVLSGAPAKETVAETDEADLRDLDQTAVHAARQAGIPTAHLKEMASILKTKPRRLEDLPRTKKPVAAGGPLSESEVEAEEEAPDDSGGVGGAGSQDNIEKALLQLTKIAGKLTEQKKKDPMDALLDAGGGLGSGAESSSIPSSRKNAAALRALQRALQENPKVLYQAIEANMASDFLSRTIGPGDPLSPGMTARGWLTAKSRIQNFPTHVRWAWQIGGVLDALMQDRVSEARARCGLLLAAADQAAIDGGSWLVSSVALLESPPPFHLFSAHQPPSNLELQHSALLDPRWVETFLSHVKDVDTYQETKKKLSKGASAYPGGKGDKEDAGAWTAPNAKVKAKAKGEKGKKEKEKPSAEGGAPQ